MPQDAFNLRQIAKELKTLLVRGKINRIVQPNKDELSIHIYTGKSLLNLILSTNAQNARVCLSQAEKETPLVAPNFCMLLRKHLLNAEITNVEQIGFERIIAFSLHCTSDFTSADRTLYCEIMGKYSNLVLVEEGVILGALKTTTLEENAHRILFAGAKYALPAPQDKASPLDKEALSAALSHPVGDEAEYLFTHVSGIAMATANDIVRTRPNHLSLAEHVYSYLFESENSPCVLYRGGVPFDFYAKAVPNATPFPTENEAQDAFFTYREKTKAFDGKRAKLKASVSNLIKKQEKNLARIYDKQKECESMEESRLKGELITSYLYLLKEGMNSCELINYYDPEGKTVKISLDKQLSPAQNAQRYYKKYNKMKRTLAALEPQLKKQLSELDYSRSVSHFIDAAESMTDLKEIEEELIELELIKAQPSGKRGEKKEAPLPFREFECEGFRILAGRNNKQNDRLLKSVSPSDIWLHVQKYHSSHVVILTEGKKVPDRVLERAGEICAYYSEAKGGNKVPVDYCERRFVKKPPKTNAGFVNYTDYKTMLVDPKP